MFYSLRKLPLIFFLPPRHVLCLPVLEVQKCARFCSASFSSHNSLHNHRPLSALQPIAILSSTLWDCDFLFLFYQSLFEKLLHIVDHSCHFVFSFPALETSASQFKVHAIIWTSEELVARQILIQRRGGWTWDFALLTTRRWCCGSLTTLWIARLWGHVDWGNCKEPGGSRGATS